MNRNVLNAACASPPKTVPRPLLVLLSLWFALAAAAQAGVTIHFEGTATSPEAVATILSTVEAVAKRRGWKVAGASQENGKLVRVIDEKDRDYEGRITGVVVRISEKCEPLYVQFGDDGFMQDFVKTQFAGPDVHIQIVELLEAVRPCFQSLTVTDEGDYWTTHDRAGLELHIAKINSALADLKRENPNAKGPLRLKSGRILDLVQ